MKIELLGTELQQDSSLIRDFTDEELTELVSMLHTLNKMVDDRDRVIKLIPECPSHGYCLPHSSKWVEHQQKYYIHMASGDHSHPLFDIDNSTVTGTKPVYGESGKQVGILPDSHKLTESDDRKWLTPDEIERVQFWDKPE